MLRILFCLFLFSLLACGKAPRKSPSLVIDQMPGTPEEGPETFHRKIFASHSKINGAFGNEIALADELCQRDAESLSLSGKFKALVTTKERRACMSADCLKGGIQEGLDWVLAPLTEYRLPDGRMVGLTNEYALFRFPLQNSLTEISRPLWTGFSDYWTNPYYSFESCARLTNPRETGFIGEASAVSADLLKVNTLASCRKELSLICVEQVAR